MALLFLPALVCAGEDRIESIKGEKGSKELTYRNGSLAEERSYDAEGGLLEERSFGPDSLPNLTSSYERAEGRLVKIESRDASGTIVGTMTYHYDSKGNLLGVAAAGSLGSGSAGMISEGGTAQGSWTTDSATTSILGYDESGRAVVMQTMKGGKAALVERRQYDDEGVLSSVAREDLASGSTSELKYDGKGRESGRTDVPAKGPEIRTQYSYDDSGRLVEELRRVGSHATSIRNSYSEDGSLARTETRRDGELVLGVEYVENGRVEELYEDGIIFVKAHYIGGRKVRDEFYSEGALLRSRDYE
jgi:antitoxin component YwqK of YwqJK toxin-antitoxin module